MIRNKSFDLFVTHAWRYHEDWTAMCSLLDKTPGLSWRNFSLPWHDPAMNPNSEVGGAFIRDFLEGQIIPVDGVILLAGVYAIKSAQPWLDLEIEFSRRHNKPLVGMPRMGESDVPENVRVLCDVTAVWDSAAVIAALEHVRTLPKYAGTPTR